MRWSEGDISTLREQWGKLSASEIARLLGSGVSRNAVIGKANRLGLSDGIMPIMRIRPKSALLSETYTDDPRRKVAASLIKGQGITLAKSRTDVGIRSQVPTLPLVAPKAAAVENTKTKSVAGGKPWAKAMPPSGTSASVQQSCRWPIGDPRSQEFHFCGCGVHPGLPYCAEHARLAYQGSFNRRRLMDTSSIASPSEASMVRPYGESGISARGEAA